MAQHSSWVSWLMVGHRQFWSRSFSDSQGIGCIKPGIRRGNQIHWLSASSLESVLQSSWYTCTVYGPVLVANLFRGSGVGSGVPPGPTGGAGWPPYFLLACPFWDARDGDGGGEYIMYFPVADRCHLPWGCAWDDTFFFPFGRIPGCSPCRFALGITRPWFSRLSC